MSKKRHITLTITNKPRFIASVVCFVAIVGAVVLLISSFFGGDAEPDVNENELESVVERNIRISFNTLCAKAGESYVLSGESFNLDGTLRADEFVFSTSDPEVATVDENGTITAVSNGRCTVTAAVKDAPVFSLTASVEVTDSAKWYGGFTWLEGILVVNKYYKLPATYDPGVSPQAQSAFNEMKAAASKDGISLWIVSGYRSYSYQNALFAQNAAREGEEQANTHSARPGESEHQTGLAFDINSLSRSFDTTAEGKWLAANAHKYGFILRFMNGKSDITGYIFEPWHFRYIGVEKATSVYESGLCLEEYLGIAF